MSQLHLLPQLPLLLPACTCARHAAWYMPAAQGQKESQCVSHPGTNLHPPAPHLPAPAVCPSGGCRDAMREGASDDDLRAIVSVAVDRKRAAHAGMFELASAKNRAMVKIGG